jgi:signal transduction histidine kinase
MLLELNRKQEMLAEAQKLKAIGTLTAGIAHELNNPINNISLTVEALLEDYSAMSDEERLDLCRDLLSQAERAHGVVKNLLDFSRQRDIQMEPMAIGELLQKTAKLVSNQMALAHVKLIMNFPPDLPPVHGDVQQLSQVFVNIILNAVDAMPQGGVVRVNVELSPKRLHFLRIDISDTGQGIAPETLPFIFDPFFSTKGAKGTGLGLSVSYGIVAKHGGTIEVNSTPGEGTTFTILLPIGRTLSEQTMPQNS